jgi:hypothetical protein
MPTGTAVTTANQTSPATPASAGIIGGSHQNPGPPGPA